MAITVTLVGTGPEQGAAGGTNATATVTSQSVAWSVGDYVLVALGIHHNFGSDWVGISLSSSGGALAAANIVTTSPNLAMGSYKSGASFLLAQVTTGFTGTITASRTAGTSDHWLTGTFYKLTGVNGTIVQSKSNNQASGTNTLALNLASAPSSTSLLVALLEANANQAWSTLASWTEVERAETSWLADHSVQYINTSGAQNNTFTNASNTGGQAGLVIEIADAGAGASPTWIPHLEARPRGLPALSLARRSRLNSPVRAQVNPPFPFPVRLHHAAALPAIRRGSRPLPVRAQVNPPYPISVRAHRAAALPAVRRSHLAFPVPSQVTFTNPQLPLHRAHRAAALPAIRRGRLLWPPDTQTAAAAPTLPLRPTRRAPQLVGRPRGRRGPLLPVPLSTDLSPIRRPVRPGQRPAVLRRRSTPVQPAVPDPTPPPTILRRRAFPRPPLARRRIGPLTPVPTPTGVIILALIHRLTQRRVLPSLTRRGSRPTPVPPQLNPPYPFTSRRGAYRHLLRRARNLFHKVFPLTVAPAPSLPIPGMGECWFEPLGAGWVELLAGNANDPLSTAGPLGLGVASLSPLGVGAALILELIPLPQVAWMEGGSVRTGSPAILKVFWQRLNASDNVTPVGIAPTAFQVVFTKPDGTTITYIKTDFTALPTTGLYLKDVTADIVGGGQYWADAKTTGAATAFLDELSINRTYFETLDRAYLNVDP